MNPVTETSTRAGMIGGLTTVLLFQLDKAEIMSTIVLAAIGATVSFAVTLVWGYIKRRFIK